jgi:hypothetical protein
MCIVTLRHIRETIVALEKQQVLCILNVSVALVIQHAKCLHRYYVVCGLSGTTLFFHISHKRHDLREKVLECKMCVLIFSMASV